MQEAPIGAPLGVWLRTDAYVTPARVELWPGHVLEFTRIDSSEGRVVSLSTYLLRGRCDARDLEREARVCRAIAAATPEAVIERGARPSLRFWKRLNPDAIAAETWDEGEGERSWARSTLSVDTNGVRCLAGPASGEARRLDRFFLDGPGGWLPEIALERRRSLRAMIASAVGRRPSQGFLLMDYAAVRGSFISPLTGHRIEMQGHRVVEWLPGHNEDGERDDTPWFHGAEEYLRRLPDEDERAKVLRDALRPPRRG